MKRSTVVFFHILYWIIYIFLNTAIYATINLSSQSDSLVRDIIGGVVSSLCIGLISYYLFYLVLVPKFLSRGKPKQFLVYGLTTIFGLAVLFVGIRTALLPSQPLDGPVDEKAPLGYTIFLFSLLCLYYSIFGFINGTIATLSKGFITWYGEIHLKEVLAKKTLQMELALIKAQLNPHFLFNTLNNIDILIEMKPGAASMFLKKLSDIMRFMLYEANQEFIPVSRELEYITKYIDLQRIRTTNEKFVNYEVINKSPEGYIAPMLFIPFIENAFKHSADKKVEDAIMIKIETHGQSILFHCRNVISANNTHKDLPNGIGIELTKQRLNLLYGERYELKIIEEAGYFDVLLALELNGN